MNPQDPQNQNPYGQQPPVGSGQYMAPSTPPTHSGHNPYEFIINPASPKRQSFLTGSGVWGRVAILGGLAVVVLIAGSIALSALGPKSVIPQFVSIDQQQEEIIRITSLASDQASNQDVQNFLANTEVSLATNQVQITSYLTDHHNKMNPKILALGKNPQTDTLFTNAAAANNYNQVVLQTVTTSLQSYAALLQSAYKLAPGTASKSILQKSYVAAELLIDQAKAITVEN